MAIQIALGILLALAVVVGLVYLGLANLLLLAWKVVRLLLIVAYFAALVVGIIYCWTSGIEPFAVLLGVILVSNGYVLWHRIRHSDEEARLEAGRILLEAEPSLGEDRRHI